MSETWIITPLHWCIGGFVSKVDQVEPTGDYVKVTVGKFDICLKTTELYHSKCTALAVLRRRLEAERDYLNHRIYDVNREANQAYLDEADDDYPW